jgi:hypothetical protein
MPAAAVFLHHGRVLGADDGAAEIESRDADIAADAFADILGAALVDLARQEGIGDGGPRRADDVELPDLTTRAISSGSVKRPTPTTGTLAMRLTSEFQGAWWLDL